MKLTHLFKSPQNEVINGTALLYNFNFNLNVNSVDLKE